MKERRRGWLAGHPARGPLTVGGVLLLALTATMLMLPIPYVVTSPGPVTDTLGASRGKQLISIDGTKTYPTSGKLDLVTVSVTRADQRMTVLEALSGLVSGDAVVPRGLFYDSSKTPAQVEQENTQQMALSQKHATAAALRSLKVAGIKRYVVVASITDGTPAAGKLVLQDRILRIDGTPVTTPDSGRAAIRQHKPGEQIRFDVLRAGKPVSVVVTAGKNPQDPKLPFVGIVPDNDYTFPFTVRIELDDVGGPSAGMMFALGIIERLTAEDITGGKVIAGTGTIDDDGAVGEIGGIQMKIRGARKAGATVFLVPAGNCREALIDPPQGIRLVKVSTLSEALSALRSLRTGQGTVPACS